MVIDHEGSVDWKRTRLDATTRSSDCKPHLKVNILGKSNLGLIDSGESPSVISMKCWESLALLGVKMETDAETKITAADGRRIEVYSKAKLPVELEERLNVMEFLIILILSCSLVLGIDFLEKMKLVPNVLPNSFLNENYMTTSDETNKVISQGDLAAEGRQELQRLVTIGRR